MLTRYNIERKFAYSLAMSHFNQGRLALTLEEFKQELTGRVERGIDEWSSSEKYTNQLNLYRHYRDVISHQVILRSDEERHRQLSQQ